MYIIPSISFQSYNSFIPYCCPLEALNWLINWFNIHQSLPVLDSDSATPALIRYSPTSTSLTPASSCTLWVSWSTNVSPRRSRRRALRGWLRNWSSFSEATLDQDPCGATMPGNYTDRVIHVIPRLLKDCAMSETNLKWESNMPLYQSKSSKNSPLTTFWNKI